MKKLIWRLAQAPSVDDLKKAIEAGIITKPEAKEMLLREEEEKKIDRDELKELKDEVKLLRELVLKLSEREPSVIKVIEEHYHHDHWQTLPKITWQTPYVTLCSGGYSIKEGDITYTN